MNRVHTFVYISLASCLVLVGWLLNDSKRQESQLKERLRESQQQEATLTIQLTEQKIRNEKLVVESRKVRTVKKPDGTEVRTETTSTTKKDTELKQGQEWVQIETDKNKKDTDTQVRTSTSVPLSKYSVTPEWRALDPYGMPTGASVGARLGALPLWVETGWDRRAGAHLGLRIEW